MILMLDNYDSFTYNLVQYLGELGEEVIVKRNDEISVQEIRDMQPEQIVVSPGPCTPNEAGISLELIEKLAGDIPILGVCLGHQAIGQVFGGKVVHARQVMHGKTSMVMHTGKGVFAGLQNPIEVTRYHSLVVEKDSLPDVLEVTAWTTLEDGNENSGVDEVMGFRHRDLPVEGVQFHPESILTQQGHAMLENFLKSSGGFLAGLRAKGETVEEIAAAARVMRELAARVDVCPQNLVDTCGTGGDGASLFNVSTACAFVVAAAGGRVAKHGNRSMSSKSGSADVLEALGVNIDQSPEQVSRSIEGIGVGFLFAPAHHSAARHAAAPRKELGTRTLFNLLGPLTNPAAPAAGRVCAPLGGANGESLARTWQQACAGRAR